MGLLRARIGGEWADSIAAGTVRFGGVDVPFGPEPGGGTVDEAFSWPAPATTDFSDDPLRVGVKWQTAEAGSWVGNRMWLTPTAGAAETTAAYNADTTDVLVTPEAVSGPRGAYVDHLFAAGVPVVPGVNYMAAVHRNRYGFTPTLDSVLPFVTARLFTDDEMPNTAYFGYGPAGTMPASSSFSFHFHVSPIVRFPA